MRNLVSELGLAAIVVTHDLAPSPGCCRTG